MNPRDGIALLAGLSAPRQYVFPKHGRFGLGGLIFGSVLVLILAFIEATQRSAAACDGGAPS